MDSELSIRRARAEDRAAMEHICAHTWEDGDYIPYVWDRWLTDGEGPLVAGEIDGRMVALTKITFQTPDQVWLQGMRVDPDFRSQGIGKRFLDHSLEYAREHGARVARLSTSIRNMPAQRITALAGMERIGVYVFWQAVALPDGPQLAVLSTGDQPAVEAFVRDSRVLDLCKGVYQHEWAWQELSSEQVVKRLQGGQIAARVAPDGRLAALIISHPDEEDEALDIGFADGEPWAVTEAAMGMRARAEQIGAKRARAWLPEVDWLREAFAAAGYAFGEWQGEMLLLERRFPVPVREAKPK